MCHGIRFVILAVSAFIFAGCPSQPGPNPAENPPNIIVLVLDDQVIFAPYLLPTVREVLIEKGTVLDNSFVSTSVCAPARATLFTGQYTHNHGELNNASLQFAKKRDSSDTVATLIHAAGYRTAMIGKYTHGYNSTNYVPPGWDTWNALLSGAPGYYNYRMSENGKSVKYGDRPEDYSTTVLRDKALQFLRDAQAAQSPFFLYLSFNAPHAPMTVSARHENSLGWIRLPTQAAEADLSDKPEWVRKDFETKGSKRKGIATGWGNSLYPKKLRTLLSVDEAIGEIVRSLEASGALDNTYIFLFADNGDDLSRHISTTGKLLPYEEGIRTPIYASGPGVLKGVVRKQLVNTVDLLPTFLEIAGADRPEFLDGRSLIPLLTGTMQLQNGWRKGSLVELFEVKHWYNSTIPPPYRLVRTVDYKYIEYETGEKEFYDLRLDPHESINTIELLSGKTRDDLSSWVADLARCAAETCRDVEERDVAVTYSK